MPGFTLFLNQFCAFVPTEVLCFFLVINYNIDVLNLFFSRFLQQKEKVKTAVSKELNIYDLMVSKL